MRVQWTEGLNHTHKQEQTIMEHTWTILPSQGHKKYHTLTAGEHVWEFDVTLPGHLPPSLNASMGKVCYDLTATLDRASTFRLGYSSTLQRKHSIRVIRSLLPSEFDLVQSLEIKNEWRNKLLYEISLPTKLYAHDTTIPVSFSILPIASSLRVQAITATLKECCSYYDHVNDKRRAESRIVKVARIDDPFRAAMQMPQQQGSQGAAAWTRVLDVKVPARPLIFCDADSDMIEIRHKLKVVLGIITADGHCSELRASIPIVIKDFFGPTIDAHTAEETSLPSYDYAGWRSLPYDRALLDRLRHHPPSAQVPDSIDARQPISIASYARSLALTSAMVPAAAAAATAAAATRQHHHRASVATDDDDELVHTPPPASIHSNTDVDDDGHIWWRGLDLSRVPSYHSVADNVDPALERCPLPPAYDPIWQRCFERAA
ncbi:hypothetical protein BC940DRAFT_327055 [Gongronella butleri]|nr:hypothetical protein BC940DRAFT_327055 [Gongronella butleri]